MSIRRSGVGKNVRRGFYLCNIECTSACGNCRGSGCANSLRMLGDNNDDDDDNDADDDDVSGCGGESASQ